MTKRALLLLLLMSCSAVPTAVLVAGTRVEVEATSPERSRPAGLPGGVVGGSEDQQPEAMVGPGVALLPNDLPAGFERLSEQDLAKMNLSPEKMAESFARDFTHARMENFRAYLNPRGFHLVAGWVISPLTVLEKASFESEVRDPKKALKGLDFKKAKIIPNSTDLGDRSIGFGGFVGKDSYVELVMVQRGRAMQFVMAMGDGTSLRALDLARFLDQRLALALEGGRSGTEAR